MKILNLFLSFFLLISLASCTKDTDDNNDNNNSAGDNTVTLIVDGQTTNYSNITAMVLDNKIVIGANNSESDIQLLIDKDIATGTYADNDGFSITHGSGGTAVFTTITNVTSVSMSITTHNTSTKYIVGTFEMSFNDNVTGDSREASGSFSITYL